MLSISDAARLVRLARCPPPRAERAPSGSRSQTSVRAFFMRFARGRGEHVPADKLPWDLRVERPWHLRVERPGDTRSSSPDALERAHGARTPRDPCTDAMLECTRFPNFPAATLVLALLMYFSLLHDRRRAQLHGSGATAARVSPQPRFLRVCARQRRPSLGQPGRGWLLFGGFRSRVLSGPGTLLAVFFAAALPRRARGKCC